MGIFGNGKPSLCNKTRLIFLGRYQSTSFHPLLECRHMANTSKYGNRYQTRQEGTYLQLIQGSSS